MAWHYRHAIHHHRRSPSSRSGSRYALREGGTRNQRGVAGVAGIAVADWPEAEPLRRELLPAEPFPLDALGDVLGDMAKTMVAVIKAPDALCAQSCLAAAALAVQAHADIEIDGRRSPVSNNFVTIGETGERKTATDRAATAPHQKWQRSRLREYEKASAEHDVEAKAWKKAFDEALAKGKVALISDKVAAARSVGPAPAPPVNPRMLTEEPTYEGLVKLLAMGWPSVGLFSDEGGRFLGGWAMAKENQVRTAAGLSKLWDGDPITRTRGGDGDTVLYGRRVSVHLMVQPAVSALLFGNELLRESGDTQPLFVCLPGEHHRDSEVSACSAEHDTCRAALLRAAVGHPGDTAAARARDGQRAGAAGHTAGACRLRDMGSVSRPYRGAGAGRPGAGQHPRHRSQGCRACGASRWCVGTGGRPASRCCVVPTLGSRHSAGAVLLG